MVDYEEAVGPARDVAGERLTPCELCRRPVAEASLLPVSGGSSLGEPNEILNLCADCQQRIAAGELTFEDAVAAGLEEADEESGVRH
jgi:hypothetical protein